MRMSEAEAERTFIRLRWADGDGNAYCPHCGCAIVYSCRRPNGAPRWRCKACRKDFSVTSGTLFHAHKLPLKSYLLAIAIFCNEVKGKSMLAMSRDLGVQYKTSFVLAHKSRSRRQGLRSRSNEPEIDCLPAPLSRWVELLQPGGHASDRRSPARSSWSRPRRHRAGRWPAMPGAARGCRETLRTPGLAALRFRCPSGEGRSEVRFALDSPLDRSGFEP